MGGDRVIEKEVFTKEIRIVGTLLIRIMGRLLRGYSLFSFYLNDDFTGVYVCISPYMHYILHSFAHKKDKKLQPMKKNFHWDSHKFRIKK